MAKTAHATSGSGTITAKINPDLMTLAKPVESLRTDDKNARRHAKRDLDVLAKSLDTYGQQKPIVVLADGKVIAGNGTLEAARSLGWTHIACVTFDNEDAARAAAFAIMDNKSAELSEWDFQALSEQMKALPDDLLSSIGFADFEIQPMLQATWTPPAIEELPERHQGKHVVAFDAEEWAHVAAAIDKIGKAHKDKLKPADALILICKAFTS